MLLTLSADQEYFRETTARFLADRVPTSRLRQLRDDPAGFDADYWSKGAELGWTSLLVSEANGGGSLSGAGAVDLSLVAHEFGRHAAPGPLVDCNVAALALSEAGGEAHRAALDGLLSGAAIAACCIGTAPWRLRVGVGVEIRKEGNEVVVDGFARPVESAGQAQHLLVTGSTDGRLTQVLVPATALGVRVKPLKALDVTRRFSAVSFAGVRLPASAVLGEIGGADAAFGRQAQAAGVVLAAESVGAMEAAFEMTLEWAFNRYTFGRPLASYQALKHRFADMKSWLEAAHAITDRAAAAVAAESEDAAELVSAARAFVGRYGVELAQDCVQLHGGIGVTYEYDLHFFLRRVTLDRMLYGAPDDHHRLIAELEIQREEAA
ncbi:acyl-CoA dehydrogenase family protein [Phenylobacterium sp. LjRoot219]|uniref:acyl-CoA dehydrogenase family protein n=1 Tax=Phenylobacterium sp. LjRoot219 TaxID=3342283 RepID=UPI003ED00C9F